MGGKETSTTRVPCTWFSHSGSEGSARRTSNPPMSRARGMIRVSILSSVPAFGQSGAIGFVGDVLLKRREVVLAGGVLDVGEEFGPLAHEVHAPPEEIAGGAHVRGIDVGHGDHAAAEKGGDLEGVDPVVLGFASVDGLHVEGVAQDEGDLLLGAEVGEPVPGEHALAADDEPFAERRDRIEEGGGIGRQIAIEERLALSVEDVRVHAPCMEIDAAVVLMLVVVETHDSWTP